jgi:hypothetical protein
MVVGLGFGEHLLAPLADLEHAVHRRQVSASGSGPERGVHPVEPVSFQRGQVVLVIGAESLVEQSLGRARRDVVVLCDHVEANASAPRREDALAKVPVVVRHSGSPLAPSRPW